MPLRTKNIPFVLFGPLRFLALKIKKIKSDKSDYIVAPKESVSYEDLK